MTLGASGNFAREVGSRRSQLIVSMPQDRSFAGSCGEEKRETAMIRREIPDASEARLAMRASVGPILPPQPSTRMSPGSAASARTVDSWGSLSASSSASTSAMEFSLCESKNGLRWRNGSGGIVLEGVKKH